MTLDNETFIVLPTEEYQDLLARAHGQKLPDYPKADRKGRRPAVAFGRASIARDIITRRLAAGWTQEELATRAGLRVETISRLESARHAPQAKTLERIEAALAKARANSRSEIRNPK
jgi:ribosome-binding protein aMBF1 (putative translation factor)